MIERGLLSLDEEAGDQHVPLGRCKAAQLLHIVRSCTCCLRPNDRPVIASNVWTVPVSLVAAGNAALVLVRTRTRCGVRIDAHTPVENTA